MGSGAAPDGGGAARAASTAGSSAGDGAVGKAAAAAGAAGDRAVSCVGRLPNKGRSPRRSGSTFELVDERRQQVGALPLHLDASGEQLGELTEHLGGLMARGHL